MTIYSIKVDKHEVVKTTEFHEAIKVAKRVLIDKIMAKDMSLVSVSEKMYVNRGIGKATYRVFATVYEKNWQGKYEKKTFSHAVRMEHICEGNYNFSLHREMADALDERRKVNENS